MFPIIGLTPAVATRGRACVRANSSRLGVSGPLISSNRIMVAFGKLNPSVSANRFGADVCSKLAGGDVSGIADTEARRPQKRRAVIDDNDDGNESGRSSD